MALSSEWKEQIEALGYAELLAEIGKEETSLGELYESLYDADQQLADIEEAIEQELQEEETQRYLERQKTIQRLRTRIKTRQTRIDELTEAALRLERMPAVISVVNRYIRLEVAASLWRTISALKGWQTREQRSLRSYQGWQTREEPLTTRIRTLLAEKTRWEKEAQTLANQIKIEEARIAYKKSILPEITLNRVSLALYLIIEEGSHEYPREPGKYYTYHKPHYRRVRHTVRYPKGRFQSILECDAFTDPSTGEIRRNLDPFLTLEQVMREEVAMEFEEEFSLKTVNPNDLTLGGVSIIADESEVGKSPYKISISRTDEASGREWKTMIQRYIMTDSEYLALTRDMTDYLKALEALG
jgi:hypothetical protein